VKGIIVNPETGEQAGEIHPGDRIVRKKSVEYLQKTEVWNLENFFKGHISEIRKWQGELSVYEKAFLFSVVTYVSYEDCHLQYDNGRDIGTEDLVQLSGISRRTAYRVIESLIKKDILYRGKNSNGRQYFVNPWLFCKGNRINKVLKTMFKNYRIRVMGGIRWKDLGD
jgi:hypothetical protein